MTPYQPWMLNFLEMIQHNAAVLLWFTRRISQQYQAQSDHTIVSIVAFSLAISQLAEQSFILLHLLGNVKVILSLNNQFLRHRPNHHQSIHPAAHKCHAECIHSKRAYSKDILYV